MWYAPYATLVGGAIVTCTAAGGSVSRMKMAPAARRATGARSAGRSRFTRRPRGARLETGVGAQRARLVRPFPGELGLGAAEVAKRGRLPVDGPSQIEALDDSARRQLEVR